jgi:hypothetical protein
MIFEEVNQGVAPVDDKIPEPKVKRGKLPLGSQATALAGIILSIAYNRKSMAYLTLGNFPLKIQSPISYQDCVVVRLKDSRLLRPAVLPLDSGETVLLL